MNSGAKPEFRSQRNDGEIEVDKAKLNETSFGEEIEPYEVRGGGGKNFEEISFIL